MYLFDGHGGIGLRPFLQLLLWTRVILAPSLELADCLIFVAVVDMRLTIPIP